MNVFFHCLTASVYAALPLVGKNPLLLEVDGPNHTLNSDCCPHQLPGRPLCLATGRNYPWKVDVGGCVATSRSDVEAPDLNQSPRCHWMEAKDSTRVACLQGGGARGGALLEWRVIRFTGPPWAQYPALHCDTKSMLNVCCVKSKPRPECRMGEGRREEGERW